MEPPELEQIARELLDLLDQQVVAIAGRNYNEFTKEEVAAYESRKRRILDLRSRFGEILKPK
jgi:predicted metal-dependent TIM-barrel fold hydrolase